jgi:hypothetical protein
LGFTGGIITQADVRGLIFGKSVVQAVDAELDWTKSAGAIGTFRFYGRGTWQPKLKRQVAQGEAWFDDGDDLNGPLVARGHAGVDWTRGATAAGLNMQYFSSYRAAYGMSNSESGSNAEIRRLQGRNRIPAQVYLDLSLRHQFSSAVEMTVGVLNILDSSPPIVADRFNMLGYSFYGDPRRRRAELVLSSAF